MGLYIIQGAQALELDGEIYFGNKILNVEI